MMVAQTKHSPKGWLAFDLNVLRRMTFSTVALPFADSPGLGSYLKRWNARVLSNDPIQSIWARAIAEIANNGHKLTADEVNVVLEDAYVPGYRLKNPALGSWFSEVDSWWFDNVRQNIDRLPSQMSQAIASNIVMSVGDYALSFTEMTRELRQPLSTVFKRLWSIQPEVFNNGKTNTCVNKNADDFLAETPAELMFLRLPSAHAQNLRPYLGRAAWREEWLRRGDGFWDSLEGAMSGKLGAATETKSQYLHLLENTLRRATHIKAWAVAHVEHGFIQTQDIVDTISTIRRVDTVFTKDFSELSGTKAVIITA
ncbi:MAG: hypothetical protein AB7J13_01620 [Pyrinomonadaceae bacterium]